MRPVVVACSLGVMVVVTHLPVDVLPAEEEAAEEEAYGLAIPTLDPGDDHDELDFAALAVDDEGLADLEDDAPAPAPHPVVVHWTGRARITAYCLQGRMRSGRYVYVGAIATDRAVIPAGSLVEIDGLSGHYVSEDTGSGVRGWHIDLYMPSCQAARQWGVQQRQVRVERWGW